MRWIVMIVVFVTGCAAQQASSNVPMPEVNADLGSCSAEFHVTDMRGNAFYDVKITTTIRHGFMAKHELELETATNSDGRARFIGLPEEAKKPITFTITNGVDTAKRSYNPSLDCHARYDLPMRTSPPAQ